MVGIEDSSIDGSGRREQLLDIPIVMADTEGGFMINKVVEKRVLVGCDFFKWGVARRGCVMDGAKIIILRPTISWCGNKGRSLEKFWQPS